MSTLNDLAKQARANSLRWFPQQAGWSREDTLMHYGLGVGGEAGEVCGVIKKMTTYTAAQQHGSQSAETLPGEIVDTLMYLFALAGYLSIDLDAAWQGTVAKCEARWGSKPPPGYLLTVNYGPDSDLFVRADGAA